ncbi:unnamed protein product [Somion occarium]|uniref:Uncharacterized protein n=1 Tax=Somion occarium TaxID=3059160 RepID=A0ABP1E374_9APHY
MSSRNPFLSSPNTNGNRDASGSTVSPSNASISADRSNDTTSRETASLHHEESSGSSSSLNIPDALSEELPPAYTPTPDVYQGETSIEFGPARPFQQPLRPVVPVAPSRVSPQQTGRQWPPPSWAGYPGNVSRQPTGRPPPPRHPLVSAASRVASPYFIPHQPVSSPPSRPISEFAQEFYAAGGTANPETLFGGSSSQYTSQPNSPSDSSSPRQYLHPPETPPRHSQPNESNSNEIPDDGKPTKTPVPGHPLLKDGRVLVYPAGFECQKCHNTGYKNYDPSQPHKKCWNKYSRPYAGAITYTPWNSASNASHASTQYQRPLPSFRPPQSSLRSSGGLHQYSSSLGSLNVPLNSGLSRSSSTSRIHSGYPGASAPSQSRVIPTPGGGVPMSPYLDGLQRPTAYGSNPSNTRSPPVTVQLPGMGRPPPGAVVVRPGDPRLGGHLCWRCGGSGTVSFLLFDETTCGVCGGVGRTF